MFDIAIGLDDNIVGIRIRHLAAAEAKWDRLSLTDYSEITNIPELIAKVEERYSLPHEQVKADVAIWAKDIQF
jgi:hypothetical protein